MSPRIAAVVFAAATFLLGPPSAFAQRCVAPPGSAAVEQYCEAIPEGDGPRSGQEFQQAGPNPTPSAANASRAGLTAAAARELASAGSDGAAIARLAGPARRDRSSVDKGRASDDTDPAPRGSITNSSRAAEGGPTVGEQPVSSLKAIPASVRNGPVAGDQLVWALLVIALLFGSFAWSSRRTRA